MEDFFLYLNLFFNQRLEAIAPFLHAGVFSLFRRNRLGYEVVSASNFAHTALESSRASGELTMVRVRNDYNQSIKKFPTFLLLFFLLIQAFTPASSTTYL